ncbi:hypothetical protein BDZ45DRAFT_57028 [Acephala macrosclerotiorum]|nr:hypothetical protein BDZ45DRAFT_57028 [Acephala macrosclerotiorum]
MSDLYRSGRGGVGNFHSRPSLDEVGANKDIEAQIESPLSLTRSTSATNPPPDYVHTGRGGAGNWVQPKDLASQGLAQESPISYSNPGAAKPSYKGGRGGAGNYRTEDAKEEERKRRNEEERRRMEVQRVVQRDVESGLARPERAYGGAGGGGAYKMKERIGNERH